MVEHFYLPPELQGDFEYDEVYKGYKKDADIWSMGMLFVEMLARNKPPLEYIDRPYGEK